MITFCNQFTISPANAQVAAFGITDRPYHFFHLNVAGNNSQLQAQITAITNAPPNNTVITPDLNA